MYQLIPCFVDTNTDDGLSERFKAQMGCPWVIIWFVLYILLNPINIRRRWCWWGVMSVAQMNGNISMFFSGRFFSKSYRCVPLHLHSQSQLNTTTDFPITLWAIHRLGAIASWVYPFVRRTVLSHQTLIYKMRKPNLHIGWTGLPAQNHKVDNHYRTPGICRNCPRCCPRMWYTQGPSHPHWQVRNKGFVSNYTWFSGGGPGSAHFIHGKDTFSGRGQDEISFPQLLQRNDR